MCRLSKNKRQHSEHSMAFPLAGLWEVSESGSGAGWPGTPSHSPCCTANCHFHSWAELFQKASFNPKLRAPLMMFLLANHTPIKDSL